MRNVLNQSKQNSRFLKRIFNLFALLTLVSLFLTLTACQSQNLGMLNPKGFIAYEERQLFFDTLALMLIVVLPVIIMSFAFVYHYQAKHNIEDYKPNWGHSLFLEILWWGIPCVIVVILGILTWKKTHDLDPYRAINTKTSPMVIQVIALPWKWLFIYPAQNIATVNYVVVPVNQQVEYLITADNVPMSAFFIPQLGSQIYAMAGMQTRLHLIANYVGSYDGMNTQFNGDGFSEMRFKVQVVTAAEMDQWLTTVRATAQPLTVSAYGQLLTPSVGDKIQSYSVVDPTIFNSVIDLYMNSYGSMHPRNNQVKFYNAL